MSACGTNVVKLVPRTLEQTNAVKQRIVQMSRDQQSLTELSRHLKDVRRDLAAEAHVLAAESLTPSQRNLKLHADAFIEQVEALEAGINKLIGAMATYQPR